MERVRHSKEERYRRIIAALIYMIARYPAVNFDEIVDDWLEAIGPFLTDHDVRRIRMIIHKAREERPQGPNLVDAIMDL